MSPLPRVVLWLTAIEAVAAGLYWALLSTPESNVAMLALSALLVLALLVVCGLGLEGALRAWSGESVWPGSAAGWLGPPFRLVPALVVLVLAGMAAGWIETRVEAGRGAITASLIARFGWADPEILFRIVNWLAAFLRWVIGPVLAVALFERLSGRMRETLPAMPVGALADWKLLLTTAAGVLVVSWIWTVLSGWRPQGLPPNVVQVAFIGAKLLVVALTAALAAALALRFIATRAAAPAAPRM